ncbi:hypothetical protein FSP39_020037 [Pinctada imbricata]|uniref:Tetratricopeptide repeat protein n=1 Tax=Pinctada imbricata TaxID=66713 RepID=A0AA88YVQ2_PINIB|nr:hypothetical protein FSP39_020037 [Pinctada imbricata]
MEYHTVDDSLKKEISRRGGLEVHSVIFALYLVIEIHIKTKKRNFVTTNIHDMEHLCDSIKDPVAYSLLGYALLKMKEPDRAAGAFKCAIDLNPKYKLARENLSMCKKKK